MSRAAGGQVSLTRRLVLAGLVALALAGVVAAWAGWQVLQAGRELQSAATDLRAAQVQLSDGADVTGPVDEAADSTAQARRHMEDPVVRLVASLPRAGRAVDVATAVAVSTDAAIAEALSPLLAAAGSDPASRLLPGAGTVDVGYIGSLATPADAARTTLTAAGAELARAAPSSGIDRLDEARKEVQAELTQLRELVDELAVATEVAPMLLGADEPRRYLVVPQNPAEARGTGGLIGGYVLLEASNGKVEILASGPNSQLRPTRVPVVDLGAEFDQHYGQNSPALGWGNANLSPHFPYAARIWSALWQRQTGQDLDGVLALDPGALSYLLRATGPVTLQDGSTVTADTVVNLTLRDAYARFDTDSGDRDRYLQEVLAATADAVLAEAVPARPLLTGLSQAVEERRLLFWTEIEAVQDVLADRALSGRLPNGAQAVGDVIVNAGGNKLDYYLERTLTYAPGCEAGTSTLSLELRNTAPASGLPDYVTLERFRPGLPPGTNKSIVTLYVPGNAVVRELQLDGQPLPFYQGTEVGQRWVEAFVTLRPGRAATLDLTFVEEAVAGKAVTRIAQPLVRPERFVVADCA